MRKEDVHLKEQYIHIAEDKTESSSDRNVPIADVILPIFEKWYYKNDSEYIFTNSQEKKMTYENFRECYFDNALKELKMKHTPHDTRHTCMSLMKEAKVELFYAKLILGHGISDISLSVYTEVDIKTLINEANKIHDIVYKEEEQK